jgi:hypothetical protein
MRPGVGLVSYRASMTTEPLSSTWPRDFALLRYVAPILDANPGKAISLKDIGLNVAGIAKDELMPAGVALLGGNYVEAKTLNAYGGIVGLTFTGITERGRRAVGLWPSEDLAASLIAALKAAEETPSTPESERTKLRKAVEVLGSMSKDIVTGVVAGIITAS